MFMKILLSTILILAKELYCSVLPLRFCPQNCICSSDLKVVTCLNQNFSKILDIHDHVEKLVLHRSSIKILPNNVFLKYYKLTTLEITECGLQVLQKQSLRGLSQLTKLNLQSNHISTLDPELFQNLTNLKTLILATNNLSTIPAAISHLKNLCDLNLSFNKISAIDFPPDIDKLVHLASLKLSYNPITSLDGLQKVVKTVKTLYLSSCQIQTVRQGIFNNFIKLKSLKLSQNPLDKLSIHNILNDLSNSTEIQSLKLNNVGLQKEHLNIFQQFQNNLINLFICCNNLETINTKTFAKLSNLQVLDLSNNQINDNYVLNYIEHLKLKELDLSQNKFTILPDSLPDTLLSLRMSSNLITNDFHNNLNHLKLLKSLDLSFNNIIITDGTMFNSLVSLETLDLSSNFIQTIPDDGFLFSNLSNMKSLNLSNNNLNFLPLNVFNELTNLKELYIGSNNLSHVIANDIKGEIFQSLLTLSVLDISNNKLAQVFSKTFDMLSKLKKLFLQGNSFKELPSDIFQNHKILELLDLSDNCLKTITSLLPLNSNLRWLNLQNNCFSCNCELLSFRELIGNKNLTVVNMSSYICFSPYEWQKREVTEFLDKPSCLHSRNVITIIGLFIAASCIILLVTFFIGKMCYYRKSYFVLSSVETMLGFKSSTQQITPLVSRNHSPDLMKFD